jgi:hypothetical protein
MLIWKRRVHCIGGWTMLVGLIAVALSPVHAQISPYPSPPGSEGTPWFPFSATPNHASEMLQPAEEPPSHHSFDDHQLPERSHPDGPWGYESPGSPTYSLGEEVNAPVSTYLHSNVPPNGAQVLPELDFRQFPQVPRQPIPGALRVRSYKDGIFQKLSFTGTYLDRGSSQSMGVTELELYASVAFPWPSREQPLILTPGFNTRFLDGPPATGIPSTVYDAYLQTMWLPQWSDNWGGIFAVTTGVYSDFAQFRDDAIRVTGRAFVKWDMYPDELQWIAGIVYLNRDDVRVLPALGLIWTPEEDVRHEFIFPRPKFAWRMGYEPGQWDDWFYLAGEFGGDTWLVERNDELDRMTMRDWRVMLGFERKRDGGGGFRVEVGYVFWRHFEFERSSFEYRPDDTVLLRLVGAF